MSVPLRDTVIAEIKAIEEETPALEVDKVLERCAVLRDYVHAIYEDRKTLSETRQALGQCLAYLPPPQINGGRKDEVIANARRVFEGGTA